MKKSMFGFAILAMSLAQSADATDCFAIEDIARNGDFLGGTTQLNDGRQVDLQITDFWSAANPPERIPGFSEVEDEPCFRQDRSLRLGNRSLLVTVEGEGTQVMSFNLCDMGGYENVGAGLAQPPKFIEDLRRVNGVEVPDDEDRTVLMELRIGPGIVISAGATVGYEAKLGYRAQERPLKRMLLGGQELFIASICID